jgi:mRNA interferase YafQ
VLKIVLSNRFKKDLRQAKKRGFKLEKLTEVVNMLARQEPLPGNYRDHNLSGEYHNFRECHVEPDWLLIYRIENKELELFLFRTGTHSDLF